MKRIILIISGAIFLINACKITDDEDRVVEIDPVFSIDLIQDLSEFGKLNIIVNSTEFQDCENYSINVDWTKTPTDIDLDLIEIIPPSDCIVGNALAESVVELGNIGNNRTYNLSFSLQDAVQNKGKLIINNRSYTIEMESWDGLGFVREELLKVPAFTVWGYVAYESESDYGEVSNDFLNDLNNLGDELILDEGYYGYFNINSNNKIGVVKTPSAQYIKHFIMHYTGVSENIENIVNQYKSNPINDGLEINVRTWNGEEF